MRQTITKPNKIHIALQKVSLFIERYQLFLIFIRHAKSKMAVVILTISKYSFENLKNTYKHFLQSIYSLVGNTNIIYLSNFVSNS